MERDDRYGRGYETEEHGGSKAGRIRGEYAARSQAGTAERSQRHDAPKRGFRTSSLRVEGSNSDYVFARTL
jgi:hypothetical protein